MPVDLITQTADSGARLAIRLLQDAAQRGEIDPWDVDVIPVVDGFLDQLKQRIEIPKQISQHLNHNGGSYELDLAQSSEAFLAASVLVGLKAEVLEAEMFSVDIDVEDDSDFDYGEQGWLDDTFQLPLRPERHLFRRPVAPPPFRRPVTLGELINQLETIAESLKNDELQNRRKLRQKKLSDREVISQVASLAHREKLPETTAALAIFINDWEQALYWVDFELLVQRWRDNSASEDLDTDRVGVFWALLFLCSQGKVEIDQKGSLFSPISLKRLLEPGMVAQLPLSSLDVTDGSPAAA
ncbi:segregation/condensation protein A [Prochlorococcus marinus]|uniref:segregation/condensation protein A n=1 Tax=Prochlorococcus marinus TaxID=1219 RepID=UPI0022B531ED|nr:segregation/condensation protein A [Prochlorococcus marinus]